MQPKTALEVLFVTFTVHKLGAGGLGSANTAALYTSVHLWLVKTKHLFFWFKASTRSSVPTVQTAPGQPPASTPSASAESRKIVSSSSSVATANGGIDSAFPLRRRGSRDQILLNRADLHTGACAPRAGRGEGRASARVPAASIVLLRGEAARRGKRGGPRGRGRVLPTPQRHVNKRPPQPPGEKEATRGRGRTRKV